MRENVRDLEVARAEVRDHRTAAAPRVVVASPAASAPFVRNSVRALEEGELLAYVATTFVDHPDYPLARAMKAATRRVRPGYVRQLERRTFHEAAFPKVRTYPFWEVLRTVSASVLRRPLLADALWETGELRFDRWVARHLDASVDAVYTYEHAALATLQRARALGIHSFYEQPSAHHAFFTRVYEEQVRRFPEIRNAASDLYAEGKSGRRNARRDAELHTADCIVCNSSFTKRTLVAAGVDGDRIAVTPLGFPTPSPRPASADGPVVFLNAGAQKLGKGAHLLYRAWRELNFAEHEAELWLVGRMELPEELRRGLPGRVRIMDSMPHAELMELYGAASVLVFPSLADGFGMVMTEAMASGLPVLATENTGAPDLIEHGENGFIVPPGHEEALRSQMRWCVEHRELLPAIGARALDTAARWQWSDYRRALVRTIRDRLDARS